jgi:hypothetical protein
MIERRREGQELECPIISSMQPPIKQSLQNLCDVMEAALAKRKLVSYYPILTYKVGISASASKHVGRDLEFLVD